MNWRVCSGDDEGATISAANHGAPSRVSAELQRCASTCSRVSYMFIPFTDRHVHPSSDINAMTHRCALAMETHPLDLTKPRHNLLDKLNL
jgi:hypothetical protein